MNARRLVAGACSLSVVVSLFLAPSPASAGAGPSIRQLPAPSASRPRGSAFDPGTVLVKFRSGVSGSTAASVLARHGLTARGAVGHTGYILAATNGRSATKAVGTLLADGSVAAAQLNFLRRTDKTPSDPLYTQYQKKYFDGIRLPQAYDVTIGSTSWSIAVLDTGVDLNHPDIKGARLKAGYDFVNNDTSAQDDNGHGTLVAGIAAGVSNNSIGVAGVAWRGGIIPVKVLDADGVGTDAEVASGIDWAADNGAKVINMSLGGPDESELLLEAVNYALTKDVVVVASAGNDGTNAPHFPAAYPGVLAVTATDKSGTFAWFSNYGWWVGITAPGVNVIGPWLSNGSEENYAIGSGTSFAAPIVAGVAVLTRYHNQSWSQSKVVDQVKKTARDRGPAGIDPMYGWGWVDAYAALGGSKQSPAPVPSKDSLEPNGTLDTATPITSKLTTPTISPEGDIDWFKANVTATGSVTFTVTPPAYDPLTIRGKEMDPVLAVYGPDLTELGTMDGGTVGEVESITVPANSTGDYYLQVTNYVGSQSPAKYTVDFSTATKPVRPSVLGLPVWVRDTTPADFSTGFSRTGSMTVTFGRDLDPLSITATTAYLKNAVTWNTGAATLVYDAPSRTLTITRTANLTANTPYVVFIDGVKDVDGNVMPLFTFRFTAGS